PSKKRSVEIPATLADRTIKLEPAKKAPVVTVETEADRIEEPAEIGIEESLPMATGVELHAQASVVAHKGVVRDSLSSAERSHFADVTLGKFDPERYRDLILESETGFAAATPESSATRSVKADRVSAEVRPRTDTVRAKLYHDESLNAAEQRGKTDSTEVRKQIMTGIAALARGDHEQAQTSLGLAYHRLPPGAQRDDVGLLLARANIQAGRFDEAKSRLQNLATIGSDPERRKLAQQAIAKLDSLRAIPPPDPAPK
ncbi:tetratricopeptide repeat protein, partial [bacterium]|nr:tetratricopeptide repeat protein [bacterium]